MESLKPKVQAVQLCQSALRIPENVVASLPLCHAALRLQEEASQLQHTAIQQYNIMQAGAAVLPAQPARPCRQAERVHMSHGLLFLALCGLSRPNTQSANFDSLLWLHKIRRLRPSCRSPTKARGKLSKNYLLVKIISW